MHIDCWVAVAGDEPGYLSQLRQGAAVQDAMLITAIGVAQIITTRVHARQPESMAERVNFIFIFK